MAISPSSHKHRNLALLLLPLSNALITHPTFCEQSHKHHSEVTRCGDQLTARAPSTQERRPTVAQLEMAPSHLHENYVILCSAHTILLSLEDKPHSCGMTDGMAEGGIISKEI